MPLKNKLLVLLMAGAAVAAGAPKVTTAAGASLYLAPAAATKTINGSFTVTIKLNTGGQVVNAAQGTISFDNSLLEVSGVSRSGSIFNLWTTEPTANNSAGTVSFGGGIPQPGYTGAAGTVCTVTFKGKKAGTADVRFSSGAVLANDGKGTNILSTLASASYTISPAAATPKDPGPAPAEPKPEPVMADYNKPNISSPTHPDQNAWSKENTVRFSWSLPAGTEGVSFLFDREAAAEPGNASDGLMAEKEFTEVEDGLWYFHLKLKDGRRWGTTAHYRVMIDATPPDPLLVEVVEPEPGEWPILRFKTTDDGSGVIRYEVIIGSLESQAHVVEPTDSPSLVTSGLEAGEHTALVKAIDKAGNETVVMVNFIVPPIAAPEITSYPAEMRGTDSLYLSGTALPGATVSLFLEYGREREGIGEAKSDPSGNWFFVSDRRWPDGRYIAWAEAANDKGIKSGPGKKVSFLVSPPVFARFGDFVINYFTVFASLLFLIVATVALIIFLAQAMRRRLKKEAVEVEVVLKKNLAELKASVDGDLGTLAKTRGGEGYLKEQARTKQRIARTIDAAGEKILKEIKDVEDILK